MFNSDLTILLIKTLLIIYSQELFDYCINQSSNEIFLSVSQINIFLIFFFYNKFLTLCFTLSYNHKMKEKPSMAVIFHTFLSRLMTQINFAFFIWNHSYNRVHIKIIFILSLPTFAIIQTFTIILRVYLCKDILQTMKSQSSVDSFIIELKYP